MVKFKILGGEIQAVLKQDNSTGDQGKDTKLEINNGISVVCL